MDDDDKNKGIKEVELYKLQTFIEGLTPLMPKWFECFRVNRRYEETRKTILLIFILVIIGLSLGGLWANGSTTEFMSVIQLVLGFGSGFLAGKSN